MSISVVVPIYNEVENVFPLHCALTEAFSMMSESYEVIFVDDGSNDGSLIELQTLANSDSRVKVIEFRTNFGQTAALRAGILAASGEKIVLIDGDLQNDPLDIPMLLQKIDAGYELVHGWRRDRHDALWTRKLPSWIANRIIGWVTGYHAHDLGCTLKAMRAEVAHELPLYGEMHRFIPVFAHSQGARCRELPVRHHPRRAGTSKYGLSRTIPVLLDLITVKYLIRYSAKPMRFFGGLGLMLASLALMAMLMAAGANFYGASTSIMTLIGIASVVSFPCSLMSFAIGVVAEQNARADSVSRVRFSVRRTINLETANLETVPFESASTVEQPNVVERKAA